MQFKNKMHSKFTACISRQMQAGTCSLCSYEQTPTQWSLTAHLSTVISAWPLTKHSISSFWFSMMLIVSKQSTVRKMIDPFSAGLNCRLWLRSLGRPCWRARCTIDFYFLETDSRGLWPSRQQLAPGRGIASGRSCWRPRCAWLRVPGSRASTAAQLPVPSRRCPFWEGCGDSQLAALP